MIQQGTGNLAEAERLFVAVRSGYGDADEIFSIGILSLDLAILYAEQGRWARVLEATTQAVPILETLRLHEETFAAVNLLAQAVDAGKVSMSTLRVVREKVLQDPLAGLSL